MDKAIIERFFKGDATEDEREKFLEWLNTKGSEDEVEQYIRYYFGSDLDKTIIWDDREVLKKLKSKIGTMEKTYQKVPPSYQDKFSSGNHQGPSTQMRIRRMRFDIGWILKIAAVLLIITTVTVLVWRTNQRNAQHDTYAESPVSKSTEYGQKLSFYLDDGSKVMLNAGSRIIFPSKFGDDSRKVTLEGEAYFEIVKNTDRPFIVETGNYYTKVLGTKFIVNTHHNGDKVTVALRSGQVMVGKKMDESAANGVLLKPGESLIIDLATDKKQISEFEDIAAFGCTDGILYFKEASFTQVIHRLEEWYDVRFIFEDQQVIDKMYSGKFVNESLDNVLKGLSFVDNFDYSIEGKNVTIKFKE